MTATATASRPVDTAQAIAQAAQAFERYATNVSATVGRRALAWQSIARQAAAAGMDPATVAPALAQMNAQATAEAARWQTWVNDLAAGRAELVPYQVGNEPIKLAVRPTGRMDGEMGWWPIVSTILTVGSRAAMAAGAYFSLDAWQDTRQVEATAQLTDAQTRAALVSVAQNDPQLARQLATATQRADAEARNAGPDWIDRLQDVATTATAGIGTAAIVILGILWWQGRKKKGSK